MGARMLVAMTAALMLLTGLAAQAQAAAPAVTVRTQIADSAEPKEAIRAALLVENSGNATMSGPLNVSLTLPDGIVVPEHVSEGPHTGVGSPGAGTCGVAGQVMSCEIDANAMLPNAVELIVTPLQLTEDASGELVMTIEVTGGGLADSLVMDEPVTVGPAKPFAVQAFDAFIHEEGGVDDLQAGAPPGTAANAFAMPTYASAPYTPIQPPPFFPPGFELPIATEALVNAVSGHVRNLLVHAPAGITANFAATPSRCTAAQLGAARNDAQLPECPPDSQIGVAHVLNFVEPIYSMLPPPGVPAEFGFSVASVPILIDAQLRPDDFGVDLLSRNTNSAIPIGEVDIAVWGVPADPSHDSSRDVCLEGQNGNSTAIESDGSCSTEAPRKAFLRLPTSCTGPLKWGIEMDSYEEPNNYKSRETTTPAQVGCNQLEFTPSFEAKPTTNVADAPSGLEAKLHLPQNEDPDGLAEAHLKDLTLQMPEGLVVNSAAADGLAACSPAQIGMVTPAGQLPAHFNGAPPSCPVASKLGAVVVNTPAIDHPLPGFVYLASQGQNPYGALLSLYLVINDPVSGVIVKVPIQAKLDPKTGQLTTVVQQSPQLPFEDLSLDLDKGAHAPLRTPTGCGHYTTQSHWTPWSSPEGKDVDKADSFDIVKGAGGGACVASEQNAPFEPKMEVGTLEPKAGAFSPFTLKLTRQDGSQGIGKVEVDLPKGLLASLGGIPYCPDAVINSIPTAPGTGQAQINHPSCPAASQLGTVSAQAGAGPNPLNVSTGKAYWTGPYKGAPVSMTVVFPAVAGPFDLGNVVIRNGFYVDRETAQITAKSDPIPAMIEGVPLDLRQVRVDLNRPNYTLNPTSCNPMAFLGHLTSTLGALSNPTEPFQVGGCSNLSFKPRLALDLKGATTRGKHPALTATLKFPKKRGANIAKASVALPHAEFLDQSHIGTVCTRVQFAAHQCPARSVYGKAVAQSPLLGYSLSGPVYLRSSSHELPDLVADLNGQIEVAVVGRVDTDKNGGIRTTFESVPDAPISKFTLKMQGGKKGLLQNSTNLCKGTHKATAIFDAQNGKSAELRPELGANCAKARSATKVTGARG